MVKNVLATGIVTFGTVALLVGCGSTTTNNTNSTNSTSSAITSTMKAKFVSVNAAAQSAIDDFDGGSTLLGTMSTDKINGKSYDVVADTQTALSQLKKSYEDLMTPGAVDNLFKNVQKINGKFVMNPQTVNDNLNWYAATVTKVKADTKNNTYQVTLNVPGQGQSASAATKIVLIEKDNSGNYSYAGLAN
jgi:hypothetical protein